MSEEYNSPHFWRFYPVSNGVSSKPSLLAGSLPVGNALGLSYLDQVGFSFLQTSLGPPKTAAYSCHVGMPGYLPPF